LIQRQVRLYLGHPDQCLPGNKGATATPTAAVVLSLFTQVMIVQFTVNDIESHQLSGLQEQPLLVCQLLPPTA